MCVQTCVCIDFKFSCYIYALSYIKRCKCTCYLLTIIFMKFQQIAFWDFALQWCRVFFFFLKFYSCIILSNLFADSSAITFRLDARMDHWYHVVSVHSQPHWAHILLRQSGIKLFAFVVISRLLVERLIILSLRQ